MLLLPDPLCNALQISGSLLLLLLACPIHHSELPEMPEDFTDSLCEGKMLVENSVPKWVFSVAEEHDFFLSVPCDTYLCLGVFLQ